MIAWDNRGYREKLQNNEGNPDPLFHLLLWSRRSGAFYKPHSIIGGRLTGAPRGRA